MTWPFISITHSTTLQTIQNHYPPLPSSPCRNATASHSTRAHACAHTQKTRWHRDPLKVSHHTVFFNIEECEWSETVGKRGNDTLKCQRGQVKAAFVTLLHSCQREDSIIFIQTNYRRSSAARGPHRHYSALLLNTSDMIRYKEMDSSEKTKPENSGKWGV